MQRYCVDAFKMENAIFQEMNIRLCSSTKKNDVVFFTNMKLKYKIMKSVVYAPDPNYMLYSLKWEGTVDMKINKQNTKFLYPNNHIYLTVGKSTKL
jgi:hypothetical protein